MQAKETGFLRPAIKLALSRKILPGEIKEEINLSRCEELLKEGYGLVILFNHFSTRDPFQVLEDIVFSNPQMKRKEIAIPMVEDQYKKNKTLLWSMAHLANIKLCPIITQKMLKDSTTTSENKYAETLTRQRTLLRKYNEISTNILDKGGIVIFAPQGTREKRLNSVDESTDGKKSIPPVASLVANLEHHKIDKVAFLLVGIGKKNETDYKIEGLNLSKQYAINIGPTYTKKELIDVAQGKLRNIDQKVLERFEDIVPTSYKNTTQTT